MDKPEDNMRGSEQVTELTISHVYVIPEYQRHLYVVSACTCVYYRAFNEYYFIPPLHHVHSVAQLLLQLLLQHYLYVHHIIAVGPVPTARQYII